MKNLLSVQKGEGSGYSYYTEKEAGKQEEKAISGEIIRNLYRSTGNRREGGGEFFYKTVN
ncbi:MAG: hypothetical protein HFF60_03095 [Oscillospiraceae bacterium]|jgi:hypothetical protein|nr:hypothetical protein [Oscillospiraceae bacterium]